MRFLIPSGNKGLTLLELLVAVSFFAILAGVAMPSFLSAMQRYRLNGAARTIASQIRYARSLAVSNGGTYAFHWGGDLLTGRTMSEYRIEREVAPCTWPDPALTPADPNVVTGWEDLSDELTGLTIASIQDANNTDLEGVMFNSRGITVNSSLSTCIPATFPLTVTVLDTSGATRDIQVRAAGSVRIL